LYNFWPESTATTSLTAENPEVKTLSSWLKSVFFARNHFLSPLSTQRSALGWSWENGIKFDYARIKGLPMELLQRLPARIIN
jgi:hypothetical protein